MVCDSKKLIRLAVAIHMEFDPGTECHYAAWLPEASWQQCTALNRKCRLARQRGWTLAAKRIQRDFAAALGHLHGELTHLTESFDTTRKPPPGPSINDVYHDLLALYEEFDVVSWDRRQRTLSLMTEPIELEGIYLGPFEIRLDWRDLPAADPHSYSIIAVDPHPAAANENVTHPHVQDGSLCEGEGQLPIRHALRQGRLLDFFLIVRNILGTYNSHSPFISLRNWYGVDCADCGSSTGEDERWTCENCERAVCGDCYFRCSGCDHEYCAECVERCAGCDHEFCQSCLTRCAKCRASACHGCLDDDERCDDCHEEKSDEVPPTCATANGEDHAPLQSHGVGEAAVPA